MSQGSHSLDRIAEIFTAVADLPQDLREPALKQLCNGDQSLEDEVRELLDHDRGEEPAWQLLVAGAMEWLEQGAEKPGQSYGGYRLVREIGRGGLGRVFLAERSEPGFTMRAAVKVLRRPLGWGGPGDGLEDYGRFDRERQILALLSHRNIAQIFDSGITDDGTPFLVMEYVEGEPIDQYCDRLRLGVRARIELFLRVCGAIAYAHRNLVIHRDIKPSNLLVTEEGEPKLLDFGISKLLDGPTSSLAPDLTRTGEIQLTPDFASPEQVRGEALTTATDQYSLGVLLYLLLTGQKPLTLPNARAAEIERVLGEQVPKLASTRPLQPAEKDEPSEKAAAALAARRASTPKSLSRQLRGDLDRILATTLRKEPERRYDSIEALATDLRHFLAGRPVRARGDSFAYVAGKWALRHRASVAAALLVLVSLLAGLAATTWQMTRAQRERDRTAQVAGFLVGMFDAADPAVARGEEITARQLLDRGAADLLATDRHDSSNEVDATLMTTIGRVYRQLGNYDAAEPLLQRSLELRRRDGPSDRRQIARALIDLGQLYDAWQDEQQARSYLEEALKLFEQGGSAPVERALGLTELASVALDQGLANEAEVLLDEALVLRRQAFGERSAEVAEVRASLAQVWRVLGKREQAEAELQAVLAVRQEVLGADHPLVVTTLNDLAVLSYERGDLAAAQDRFAQTVEMRRRILGPQHPYLGSSLLNLGATARLAGDREAAEASLAEALSIYRQAFGDEHERIAMVLAEQARLERDRGDIESTLALFDRARAIRSRVLGPRHPNVASSDLDLAPLALLLGDSKRAEGLYREALSIQEEALGPADPGLAVVLLPLGRLLLDQGRLDEAGPVLQRAVELLESSRPEGDWRIAEARGDLGRWLVASGKKVEGLTLMSASLAHLEAQLGTDGLATSRLRQDLQAIP